MPKAADLVALVQRQLEAEQANQPQQSIEDAQAFCDQRNAIMASKPKGRHDIEWTVVNGSPQLRYR